jgi:transposase InsO family protein
VAWKEVVQSMAFRKEIVGLAQQAGANLREICRRFKVSPKTLYKWIGRYRRQGEAGLENRSRRPHRSPRRIAGSMEKKILSAQEQYRGWGARKIRKRLQDLGHQDLPAASAIHRILVRNGRIDPAESIKHQAWQRFEHAGPNQLWQMDFKGWFRTDAGLACHPLTVLDDHSRFVLCLEACRNQQTETVQSKLTQTFRLYGLPERMTMDNGSPWGGDDGAGYTPLTVWLIRLGIAVSHSRPYHPQTQGKDERFHRTLGVELLRWHHFRDIQHAQQQFDPYRQIYNYERPHQAIGMNVPASRYQISRRRFPETLPALDYDSTDTVCRVNAKGHIYYQRQRFVVGKAFHGYPVAIRPTEVDHIADIYFCHQRIHQIDLRSTKP